MAYCLQKKMKKMKRSDDFGSSNTVNSENNVAKNC